VQRYIALRIGCKTCMSLKLDPDTRAKSLNVAVQPFSTRRPRAGPGAATSRHCWRSLTGLVILQVWRWYPHCTMCWSSLNLQWNHKTFKIASSILSPSQHPTFLINYQSQIWSRFLFSLPGSRAPSFHRNQTTLCF
jgi:hypothetical protein